MAVQITITEGRAAPTVAQLRVQMSAAIERLIAVMDALDGDADIEDGGDGEPSLTWPDDDNGRGRRPVAATWEPDLEQEADDEPSLGSIAMSEHGTQAVWAAGATDDAEGDEHDGREPEDDSENDLGATTAMNQDHAWSNHCKGWSVSDGEPSLGWTGHGHGHPETAMRGYDDDREATTGPRDEEWDDAENGIADHGGLHEAGHGADGPGDFYGSGCAEADAPADPWPMTPA